MASLEDKAIWEDGEVPFLRAILMFSISFSEQNEVIDIKISLEE